MAASQGAKHKILSGLAESPLRDSEYATNPVVRDLVVNRFAFKALGKIFISFEGAVWLQGVTRVFEGVKEKIYADERKRFAAAYKEHFDHTEKEAK